MEGQKKLFGFGVLFEFVFVGYDDLVGVPASGSVTVFPFLLELFEAAESLFFDVFWADISEPLPEFSGYDDVSLCFAEPSVPDCVGFADRERISVDAASLSFGSVQYFAEVAALKDS